MTWIDYSNLGNEDIACPYDWPIFQNSSNNLFKTTKNQTEIFENNLFGIKGS